MTKKRQQYSSEFKAKVALAAIREDIGITQMDDKIWLVTFMHYDLGCFDETRCRLESINNPFASKLYTMS